MIINNTNKVLFTSYMCNENDDIVQTILRKWKELNPSFKIFYFSHGNTLPKGERSIPLSLGARRDQRFA